MTMFLVSLDDDTVDMVRRVQKEFPGTGFGELVTKLIREQARNLLDIAEMLDRHADEYEKSEKDCLWE